MHNVDGKGMMQNKKESLGMRSFIALALFEALSKVIANTLSSRPNSSTPCIIFSAMALPLWLTSINSNPRTLSLVPKYHCSHNEPQHLDNLAYLYRSRYQMLMKLKIRTLQSHLLVLFAFLWQVFSYP